MKKFQLLTLISIIVLLAFLLRTIRIDQVPPGLNRDEASIGYTAYSLLKTQKDEYGKFLPLSLKSFGDWKLPLYIYLTIPAVAIFGLSELAVRLPSAIIGSFTVLLTYLMAYQLFKKKSIGLCCAMLLAISPWHVFFSRVASEANLAVFIFALSIYLLAIPTKKKIITSLSVVVMALTLLTYHGNHIFTPIMFVVAFFTFTEKFRNKSGMIAICLFVLISSFVLLHTLLSADKTKISGLFALNDQSVIHEKIVSNRLIYSNLQLGKLFNNKLIFIIETTVHNYLRSFSPEFLFISGGTNKQHNIPDFGNLYIFEAPFLLLGLYLLFKNRQKYSWFLLIWILVSAFGSAVTKDAPHSARQFAIFPAVTLVTGYGIVELSSGLRRRSLRVVLSFITIVGYLVSFLLFSARYFVVFPYKSYANWGAGYKQMVEKIVSIQSSYDKIVIARPDYSPYIYYLFFTKADPWEVQRELTRYTDTSEGFSHVKAFKNIEFRQIDWAIDLHVPRRLYIDWAEGVPSSATQTAVLLTPDEKSKYKVNYEEPNNSDLYTFVTSSLIDTINLPNRMPLFYFIETKSARLIRK